MELQRREMFLTGNRSKTVLPGTPADGAMVLLFCSPNSPAGWPVVHRQICRSASTWGMLRAQGMVCKFNTRQIILYTQKSAGVA